MVAALFFGFSSSVLSGGLALALAAVSAILGRRLFRLAPIGNSVSSPSIESVATAFRRIGWVIDQEGDRWVSGLTANRIFFPRHRVTVVSIGGRLFFNSHPSPRAGIDAAFERNRRMLELALSLQTPTP
jgi:hypothetical protein